MFKEYKEGEKWTFVKNPNYWNKDLPYLDTLELINVAAWSDRGTAVLTSQADLSWNVSKETWDEGAKRTDTINTNRVTTFGAYQVIINVKQKPFDDPRVRRAVHLALNRQGLIQAFQTQEQIDLSRWVPHGGEFATPRDKIATLPGYRAGQDAGHRRREEAAGRRRLPQRHRGRRTALRLGAAARRDHVARLSRISSRPRSACR